MPRRNGGPASGGDDQTVSGPGAAHPGGLHADAISAAIGQNRVADVPGRIPEVRQLENRRAAVLSRDHRRDSHLPFVGQHVSHVKIEGTVRGGTITHGFLKLFRFFKPVYYIENEKSFRNL